jgi:hypothetical protein
MKTSATLFAIAALASSAPADSNVFTDKRW